VVGGVASDRRGDDAGPAGEDLPDLVADLPLCGGVTFGGKHQAAFHHNLMTWMKSATIRTVIFRLRTQREPGQSDPRCRQPARPLVALVTLAASNVDLARYGADEDENCRGDLHYTITINVRTYNLL
jgi:hypothetical protein